MEVSSWVSENWFDLIQTLGIVLGLLYSTYSLHEDRRSRKISNLYVAGQHHREIWSEMYRRPQLSRILRWDPDLAKEPITNEEFLFVKSLILHLDLVRRALEAGLFVEVEGLREDIRSFFSLPIPGSVWQKLKPLQNREYVRFVDELLDTGVRI